MTETGHKPQENILVIKLGALGDFIQATGAMKAIRNHHKNARITLLTTKPFGKLAEKCGYFDTIIIDQKPKFYNLILWANLRSTLLNAHFTRIYDLQNNDRTALYFRLFPKSKRPEWVGAAKGASHENSNPLRTAGHALDGHIQTLALAGITDITVDTLDWIKEDISRFKLKKLFALLICGSAPQHPQKRWPADTFAALADHLHKNGLQPVLLGTPAESEVTNRIAALCPHVINLTGQTNLFEIAALAKDASLAVGNDTGPMHIIAATGCPSLILFSGHSNPARHTPKGEKVTFLQENNIQNIQLQNVLQKISSLYTLTD